MSEEEKNKDTLEQISKSVKEHNEKWDRINEERIKYFDFLNHQITEIGSNIRVLSTKINEMNMRFDTRLTKMDKRLTGRIDD